MRRGCRDYLITALDCFYLVLVQHNLFIAVSNPHRVNVEDPAGRCTYPVAVHNLPSLPYIRLYTAISRRGRLTINWLDYNFLPYLIGGRHRSTLIEFWANHSTKRTACQPPFQAIPAITHILTRANKLSAKRNGSTITGSSFTLGDRNHVLEPF